MSSQSPAPDQHPPENSTDKPAKRRRWPRIVGGIFVVLLLLVFFAPSIASREPVRSWILKKALPGLRGTITCSNVSFGWFSPIEIDNIAVTAPPPKKGTGPISRDGPEGVAQKLDQSPFSKPVITIAKIAGNRPLWEILSNTNEPGDFEIEKPVLDVVLTDTGSNLKNLYEPPPKKPQTPKQLEKLELLKVGVRIDAAQVSVSGREIPRGWKTQPIDASICIADGLLATEPLTLFDHSELTPGACRDFLQFVAPILADITTVEGRFSLKLDEWKVPLTAPKQTTGQGVFHIESLNVSPSPLVANIADLLKLNPNLVAVKDCPVKFKMKDERVEHVNLTFYIEGIQVRTTGSVGLDETLDMTVEIPVPKHLLSEKLLGNGPLIAAIKEQTVILPVGGTLSKPTIDTKRLGGAIQSMVRGTMKSLGREEETKVEGLIQGLIDRKPDEKVDTEKLIGDIIGTAGELSKEGRKLLEQRRKSREKGEPTLLDRFRLLRPKRDKEEKK
ncbi:MAG: hypothetical protein JXM70_01055 [Pirellulales bacterium]|nr:hypothetical protein [Pirellulales bacterium]